MAKSKALAEDPNTAAVVAIDEKPPGASREQIEALGLDPDKVSADDPAITGIPRDERHDSIDPHTGTLTEEAQQLRREQAEAANAE